MTGVAGASIGLAAGQQQNIAPSKTLFNGMGVDSGGSPVASSRGCTTNFIGFGFGLTSQDLSPPDAFSATDDTVVRATTSTTDPNTVPVSDGTVQTPTYTAISGSVPPAANLSWATGSAAAAPVNTVVPTITGTATVGSTLTAGNGTWTGNPTPTYTYEWLVGGIVKGTASTYVPVTSDIGKTAVLRVTGRNPVAAVAAVSVATAVIS
jgi:hypothetical protein